MKYRITALLPTEMYVDAESEYEAKESIQWLLDQYPTIDSPISDSNEIRLPLEAKIVTVEEDVDALQESQTSA